MSVLSSETSPSKLTLSVRETPDPQTYDSFAPSSSPPSRETHA